MSCITFVCMLILGPPPGFPSINREKAAFRTLSTADGLSHNQVTAILQDSKGFLWFATESGLNRYDGYTFTTYMEEPFNSKSLSDSHVETLFESKDGVLWVGCKSGLNRFDPQTGSSIRYFHNPEDANSLSHNHIKSIAENSDGTLWVATWGGGLNLLDPLTGMVTRIMASPNNSNGLVDNAIRNILVDQDGLLWIGTRDKGLQTYNRNSGQFKSWNRNMGSVKGIPSDKINGIVQDSLGQIWIGTRGGGLLRYLPSSDSFEQIDLTKGSGRSVQLNNISMLHIGRDGSIWVGTWGAGVCRLNTMGGVLQHFVPNSEDPNALENGWVRHIYEDHSRVLWVALMGHGASFVENLPPKFTTFHDIRASEGFNTPHIASIEEDRDGNIWMGAIQGGLNRYDPISEKFTNIQPEFMAGALSHPDVHSILEDPRSDRSVLWLGTGRGISEYDRTTGVFTNYYYDPNDPNSAHSAPAMSLATDGRNVVYVGFLRYGAGFMDLETKVFTRFPLFKNTGEGLSDEMVFDIAMGRRGEVWLGTDRGLNKYDPESGHFTHFFHEPTNRKSISHSRVKVIHQARNQSGTLWLGTSGGLNRFDIASETAQTYSTFNNSLSNNEVNGILEEDNGILWVGTNRGLNRFDPETEQFHLYDLSDGLTDMDLNLGAFHRLRNGQFLIGGPSGLNAFFPDNILANPHPPKMQVTEIRVNEIPINSARDLKPVDANRSKVILSHRAVILSVDFVALHYGEPRKNRQAYKLEGFDDNWIIGYDRTARYTNLRPGSYTFKIKGYNKDGVMSEIYEPLEFVILAPWWKSSWAMALYVFLGFGVLFGANHLERERLLARQRRTNLLERSHLRAETAEARALAIESEYKRGEMERRYLEAENARKGRELELARSLQMSLLPEVMPKSPEFDMAVHMETATEVGGDYYDFQYTSDGAFTLALGDAAGHGLQAGNLVIATKSLFNAMGDDDNIQEFLASASSVLKNMGFKKMFMALMLARLKNRKLTLSSAGMPFALLYKKEMNKVEPLVLKGLPLGAPYVYPYQSIELLLSKDDMVLMMSDGLQELFNNDREMLGLKKVRDWFELLAAESPKQVISGLLDRAREWSQGRATDDDITLLVLKIR